MMKYSHAKDYLLELANEQKTHGWQKELIIRIVNTNGKLSDSDIDVVFQLLINNSACLSVVPTVSIESSKEIRLVNLMHHKGVNALASEQMISFSNDITLLYGPNGSGKSSYFRIINEIVGGNHQAEVRPNIYKDNATPIDVELSYTLAGVDRTIRWDGTQRAIEPLNLVSVFDTSYTDSFLEKRSADTAIVAPYGLHLFSVLTDSMEKLKARLNSKISDLKNSLPNIDTSSFLDDTSRVVAQQYYLNHQKKYIESRYEITDEARGKLESLLIERKELEATNYDDKLKIANSEKFLVLSLYNHFIDLRDFFTSVILKIDDLLKKLIEARAENRLTKSKIEILNEIGATDSKEWKEFVLAGENYLHSEEIQENICPYCRQVLSTSAKNIINAYSIFLADKSEVLIKTLLASKESLLSDILGKSIDVTISEQLKKLLIDKYSAKLIEEINDTIKEAKLFKNHIRDSIIQEDNKELVLPSKLQSLIAIIAGVKADCEGKIQKLTELKTKKESQIHELNSAIRPLGENLSVHEQREQFKEWFSKVQIIREYEKMQSSLSTRNVSMLAKTASQTLVTENLKLKFEEELNALNLTKLHVSLNDAGALRGQTYMRIQLKDNITAKEILSEGEQKGVALALFIAERRMQMSMNPIILDDPVNSLDQFIIASLVERLSQLGNQIIIFSHNLLLQTSLANLRNLHSCGINQISSCNKQTRHLYQYKIQSQGRDCKGVISEMKQDSAVNNLLLAKRKLDVMPFTDHRNVAAILRHSIELLIDEKVFNNLTPLKYHGKKNNIQWDQLKAINPNPAIIDTLSRYYSRLSGGDLHLGVEQQENPIEYDEMLEMYNALSTLI